MKLLSALAVPLFLSGVMGARQEVVEEAGQQDIIRTERMKPAIGVHFTTSYAVASIRHENGEFEDLVRVQAGAEYIDLVALWNDKREKYDCSPEATNPNRTHCELKALARKENTGSVAVLSSFMGEVKSAIEEKLGTNITDIMPTFPPLVQPDGMDLSAAFYHVGLEWMKVKGQMWPYLRESNAAYAGFGYGLSKDPADDDALLNTLNNEFDRAKDEAVLFLTFDNSSFIANLQYLQNPYQMYRSGRTTDLSLGWCNLPVYEMYEAERKEHFDKIHDIIVSTLEGATMRPPKKIILLGDHAKENEFLEVVKEALWDQFQYDASLLLEANYEVDTSTIAARGAAELAFRAMLPNKGDGVGAGLLSNLGSGSVKVNVPESDDAETDDNGSENLEL